jgi:hypothetical protein
MKYFASLVIACSMSSVSMAKEVQFGPGTYQCAFSSCSEHKEDCSFVPVKQLTLNISDQRFISIAGSLVDSQFSADLTALAPNKVMDGDVYGSFNPLKKEELNPLFADLKANRVVQLHQYINESGAVGATHLTLQNRNPRYSSISLVFDCR